MYEDMTFENIMDSMMEDMPDGLDTSPFPAKEPAPDRKIPPDPV